MWQKLSSPNAIQTSKCGRKRSATSGPRARRRVQELIRLYGAGGDGTKLHVVSYLSGVRTSESMTKIREIANGETDPVIREKALDYVLGR